MIKAQVYGNGGVLDYSDVKVYEDTAKLVHADMANGIVLELTRGDSKLYIKLSTQTADIISHIRGDQVDVD